MTNREEAIQAALNFSLDPTDVSFGKANKYKKFFFGNSNDSGNNYYKGKSITGVPIRDIKGSGSDVVPPLAEWFFWTDKDKRKEVNEKREAEGLDPLSAKVGATCLVSEDHNGNMIVDSDVDPGAWMYKNQDEVGRMAQSVLPINPNKRGDNLFYVELGFHSYMPFIVFDSSNREIEPGEIVLIDIHQSTIRHGLDELRKSGYGGKSLVGAKIMIARSGASYSVSNMAPPSQALDEYKERFEKDALPEITDNDWNVLNEVYYPGRDKLVTMLAEYGIIVPDVPDDKKEAWMKAETALLAGIEANK